MSVAGPTPSPEGNFFRPIFEDIVGDNGNGTTADTDISSQGLSEVCVFAVRRAQIKKVVVCCCKKSFIKVYEGSTCSMQPGLHTN